MTFANGPAVWSGTSDNRLRFTSVHESLLSAEDASAMMTLPSRITPVTALQRKSFERERRWSLSLWVGRGFTTMYLEGRE